MSFPFQQIQSTVKLLVPERLAGWKTGKNEDHLSTGSIINGRYRIEETLRRDGSRGLNTVRLVWGGAICDSCRLKEEEAPNPPCYFCQAKLEDQVYQMEVVPWQIQAGLTKTLLGISHPGVAEIYDIFSVGSHTYVVFEYISGPTLDGLDGPLTTHQIRMLGIYLAQTVEFLHCQGISHLNLQPSNLKLAKDRPRLMSLTTSKLRGDLSREDVEWVDREDFRGVLETLEKLAGEYVDRHEEDMLCRLLFALEEMIGGNELSPLDIFEALAPARFETDTKALWGDHISVPETQEKRLLF